MEAFLRFPAGSQKDCHRLNGSVDWLQKVVLVISTINDTIEAVI